MLKMSQVKKQRFETSLFLSPESDLFSAEHHEFYFSTSLWESPDSATTWDQVDKETWYITRLRRILIWKKLPRQRIFVRKPWNKPSFLAIQYREKDEGWYVCYKWEFVDFTAFKWHLGQRKWISSIQRAKTESAVLDQLIKLPCFGVLEFWGTCVGYGQEGATPTRELNKLAIDSNALQD